MLKTEKKASIFSGWRPKTSQQEPINLNLHLQFPPNEPTQALFADGG